MLFLVPGIASVVLLALMWRGGFLSRPGLVAAWCAAGLVLQFFAAAFSPVWVMGLLINVGVAIYLSIRLKLS
jgi:hypothetical protein